MLNKEYLEQVKKDLTKADAAYTSVFKKAVQDMERLQKCREQTISTIKNVEICIIAFANRPRGFDTSIGEIKTRYMKFIEIQEMLTKAETEHQSSAGNHGGAFGAAGAIAGAGLATLGPGAAMSVAMILGSASTGTAIASLSGVAATNAALAWLGGGALAAGGAGVVGGSALLTVLGPIGWAISGGSLIASLIATNYSNKEMAKKVESTIAQIKKEQERIQEIDAQVVSWTKETIQLRNTVSHQLIEVRRYRKKDYTLLTDEEIQKLMKLVHTTEVLSKKLGETIKQE